MHEALLDTVRQAFVDGTPAAKAAAVAALRVLIDALVVQLDRERVHAAL